MTTQPAENLTPDEVEAILDDTIAALDLVERTVVDRAALAVALGLPVHGIKSESCGACGAKTKPWGHVLNVPLIEALRKLDEAGGGPINLRTLHLGRDVSDNFQKLRYFDLVTKGVVDGKRKRGYWTITDHGRAFIRGQAMSPFWVVTYRGARTHYEGPAMTVDLIGLVSHRQRDEYAADTRPEATTRASKVRLAIVPDAPTDGADGTHADGMPDVR